MSCFKRDSMSRWRVIAFSAMALVSTALLFSNIANAQVVATYDFEDGTTQGWSSFNNASIPVNSTITAFSGTHSLLTMTNSSGGSSGPALLLSGLLPGATYQITGRIMLTTGEAATNANFTVQRQDPGCSGGTCYDTVGAYQVPVSDSGWAQLGGAYTISTTATSMVLYAQLVGPTTAQSFYLDDVVVTEIAAPPGGPQDNSGIVSTFEDGGLDGWSARIGSTVTNSSADAHSGTHSLLTTGRVQPYDGPQLNVSNKMYNGSQYSVSVWVKLGPSATQSDTIRVSLQTTLAGAPSYRTVIGNTTVPLGQWVLLTVRTYSMISAYDPGQAFLYVESNSGTQDFYIDDLKVTYLAPVQIQTDIPSIYQTLAKYFPVGTEVDQSDLSGVHAQLLTKHFNSIVSGNDMKWSSVESTKGSFNYANADAQVGLAQCAGMRVRGHNLVWANGSQVPSYATGDGTNSPANQALVTDNIREHIQNEVQHFGNKVYAWDVVNEPLDPSQPDCLVHGPFYKVLGANYLDVALQAARDYAPAGTKLFINDYSTTDANRLACLVKVASDLKSKGLLDGVGHEMHNAINYPSVPAMVNAIETVANQVPGIDQQVTELDVSVYNAGDTKSNYGNNVPPAVLAEQGWLYKAYFDAFRELKDKLSSVTMWGMADDDTWLDSFPVTRTDYPLPFDMGLQAKPAYLGIVDPTKLPGYGLKFAATQNAGTADTRTITVTATNGNVGPAYATTLSGFTLTQTSGPACTPKIVSGKTPAVLGDIATNGTASASFTVSIVGCNPLARFKLSVPWSSAVYDTGTFVTNLNLNRGQ